MRTHTNMTYTYKLLFDRAVIYVCTIVDLKNIYFDNTFFPLSRRCYFIYKNLIVSFTVIVSEKQIGNTECCSRERNHTQTRACICRNLPSLLFAHEQRTRVVYSNNVNKMPILKRTHFLNCVLVLFSLIKTL